jgi:copper resistance protein C
VAAGRPRRQLLLFGAVSAAILLVLSAWYARPAAPASDRVLATVPADGGVLVHPPGEVDLRLSAPPDPALSHVTVRDGAGSVVNAGTLRESGTDGLAQPIRNPAPGTFTVTYHVVFADGQERIGSVRFSAGTGAPPSDVTVPAESHVHGVDPVSAVLLVADVVVLLGAVVLLLFRRRRRY